LTASGKPPWAAPPKNPASKPPFPPINKAEDKMSELVSLAKSILDLTTGINNATLIKQVADLNLAIARSEEERAHLIEENAKLKEENRNLREDRENPLVFNKEDNLYYHPSDEKHESPFCQHCYEAEHLRIHLTKTFDCPHCHTDFPNPSPRAVVF
jgi:cell division protein FtsB